MSTKPTVEERLSVVEKAVADIQKQLAGMASAQNWLQGIIGSFKDEPAFDEVLEYGRAFRAADLPPEDVQP